MHVRSLCLGVALSAVSIAPQAFACEAGTTCLSVKDNGSPNPGSGTFTAQCSGRFPDLIFATAALPSGYAGPWFRLSQAYPATAPAGDAPWLAIDFRKGPAEADQYLFALRDYAFEGMTGNDFRPEKNTQRAWYHMPLMNFGANRREPAHGLTGERPVKGPELGLKTGATIHDYAVGFYNAAAAVTLGKVWASGTPDLTKAHFDDGAMAFKILFSDAKAEDYQDPAQYPLQGAPAWTILTANGPAVVHLMQMDVAATATGVPSGWVFGTFAFDPAATDADAWRRLRPVGLSWGNDTGVTPAMRQAGTPLTETIISGQAPAYAANHLGWAGRTNGPVDNPISGCISCHGTAQYPVAAPIAPFSAKCDSDAKKLAWFRDIDGATPFGAIDAATCQATASPVPLAPLDFSLQLQVSVQSTLQFGDVNPCAPATTAAAFNVERRIKDLGYLTARYANAPRVSRGD